MKKDFHLLSDKEKKEARRIFLKSLDKKINETKALIKEMNHEMKLELELELELEYA